MRYPTLVMAFALGLVGLSGASSAYADPPAAIGFWLNQAQGWVIETVPCASGVCGYLVGFRNTKSADYVAKDSQNPDPAKRGTPLCGLMMLGGFTPSEAAQGKWENGWVYDPDTGSTYRGVAEVVGADTINVRGYVLVPLFGKTLTLIREVGLGARCSVPASGPNMESADAGVMAENLVRVDYAANRRH